MPAKALMTTKIILGILGSAVALLIFLTPYLNIVARADQLAGDVALLKSQQAADHDLVTRMLADISYIKDTVRELKERR